ncbi:MAG: type II toxin-antitoxin system HicB family antitoxin [Hyphomicrobiaceae bacterium]
MPHTTTEFRDRFRDIHYFGILDGDAGAYRIVIPDFPNCTGEGATVEEAVHAATNSLRIAAGLLWVTDKPLPKPSGLDAIHKKRTVDGEPEGIDYRITLHEEHA